ncbi:hypothetical protein VNO78_20497 [Psophocarpus tetragonolobus]|uniref:Uncharacterized protein n=1 Tax=Psophocarpus tetragonolobus TaxID=3891 RepID=A0AAN9SAE6_PSOTE
MRAGHNYKAASKKEHLDPNIGLDCRDPDTAISFSCKFAYATKNTGRERSKQKHRHLSIQSTRSKVYSIKENKIKYECGKYINKLQSLHSNCVNSKMLRVRVPVHHLVYCT